MRCWLCYGWTGEFQAHFHICYYCLLICSSGTKYFLVTKLSWYVSKFFLELIRLWCLSIRDNMFVQPLHSIPLINAQPGPTHENFDTTLYPATHLARPLAIGSQTWPTAFLIPITLPTTQINSYSCFIMSYPPTYYCTISTDRSCHASQGVVNWTNF